MKVSLTLLSFGLWAALLTRAYAADSTAAKNNFSVELPSHAYAERLLPESPFGINTAFRPNTPDLEARLKAMRQAGIKWGRQDFTWKNIEKSKGKYEWVPYDELVEKCHQHGLLPTPALSTAASPTRPRNRPARIKTHPPDATVESSSFQ